YSVTDTGDGSAAPLTTGPVTLSVSVSAVNDAPVAQPASLTTPEDIAFTLDLATLASDVETPTSQLTFHVTGAQNGTVTLLADGHTAQFTPATDYSGVASFDYSVTDAGDGASPPVTTGPVPVTVSIGTVNHAPVAATASLSTLEDT